MSTAGRAVVDVDDVGIVLGGTRILEDVNLEVEAGEIVALVGGSGSGKTTLLRQIIGLLRPSEGTIRVFGEPLVGADPEEQRSLRSRFGVLFQGGALFSDLDVRDNIGVPLREVGIRDADFIAEVARRKLLAVGLTPSTARKMPAELSGGMVKRVALARALALEPELLLLDEPTSGLDPHGSERLVELLRSLHDQLDLTIVLITHDLDTIVDLCHRVAVLAEGTIVAYGTLDEVAALDHPFIEDFFRGRRGRRALSEAIEPR